MFTPGNVDDRTPLPKFARRLFGKLIGDRGDLSQPLCSQLWEQGIQLITKLKKKYAASVAPAPG